MFARFTGSEGAVRKLMIACMALGFVSLIAAAIAAAWLNGQNAVHSEAVTHTYEVELAVNRARIAIEQTETTRRGFIIARQQVYLDAYRQYNAALPASLKRIDELTADNPGQQARVAVLRQRVAELIAARETSIRLLQSGQADAAIAAFTDESGARRLRAIRDTFDAMIAEEQRLLGLRDGELQRIVSTVLLGARPRRAVAGAGCRHLAGHGAALHPRPQQHLGAARRTERGAGRSGPSCVPPTSPAPTRKSSASPISSATICARRSST